MRDGGGVEGGGKGWRVVERDGGWWRRMKRSGG